MRMRGVRPRWLVLLLLCGVEIFLLWLQPGRFIEDASLDSSDVQHRHRLCDCLVQAVVAVLQILSWVGGMCAAQLSASGWSKSSLKSKVGGRHGRLNNNLVPVKCVLIYNISVAMVSLARRSSLPFPLSFSLSLSRSLSLSLWMTFCNERNVECASCAHWTFATHLLMWWWQFSARPRPCPSILQGLPQCGYRLQLWGVTQGGTAWIDKVQVVSSDQAWPVLGTVLWKHSFASYQLLHTGRSLTTAKLL